jgi:threonine dehydrogenase-like Zn-dependent dehydrogenase
LISNFFESLSFRVQFMKQVVYIQRGGGESITHFGDGPEHNGHSTPVWVLSQILPEATSSVKALVLKKPGEASVETVLNPVAAPGEFLLRVRMVGFCGRDLNSCRGRNPLITFPRIPGHEVSATVVEGDGALLAGTDVALSPYTSCGSCASCRRGRSNACQFNQTLGVQRDGALAEFVAMPREKLYPAKLTRKELCLVEPLTVGFHAVARGRIKADDTVAILGCGGVGLGAVAASSARSARTICVDMDDEKLAVAQAAGGSDAINTAKESLHDRLKN